MVSANKYLEKMKAPGDFRPTWRNGVLQIHITRACDLSCVSCTQGSNLGGKPNMITTEQFAEACTSLTGYTGVIGVFGGNPTLHPEFEKICRIFKQLVPFEQRGLWSNNLRGYGKLCREIFNPEVSNLNVHTSVAAYEEMKRDWPECNIIGMQDSRHSPPFVSMNDIEELSEEKKWELISHCDINQLWSAMICTFRGELRGYFCELAGAQSMLHQHEEQYPDTGIRLYPGWWKLPIRRFEEQIRKHCFECGIPLKGRGDLAVNGNNEYVSKTHLPIYNLKKKGKTLNVVSKLDDLGGYVGRATDYIQNGIQMNGQVKVALALPTAEFARRADFYDYYSQMIRPEGTIHCTSHGQSPARNRNLMIRQALEHNATHIMFIDDDMALPSDIITRLLAHDKDIVTGLYLMRNYPHFPIIFDEAYDDGRCKFSFLEDGRKGLVEIVNTGLGCCLIKTDVFRKLADPWITLGECEPDHWCDDISFFNRCRKAGYKLYCDLDVQVGHMITGIVFPRNVDGKWFTMLNTGSEEGVQFPQMVPTAEEIAKDLERAGVK